VYAKIEISNLKMQYLGFIALMKSQCILGKTFLIVGNTKAVQTFSFNNYLLLRLLSLEEASSGFFSMSNPAFFSIRELFLMKVELLLFIKEVLILQ
jgi:hypothetical protein